ncbi:hypothetical protein N7532_003493 [Penicillium argentinense]|uniref:Tho complex subunit 7 n=1 Tax=Penicillium argentinense TaxID=1131581 RepID=A0A9W9FMM3_9EURO|nr:uncharacterized protein N7532_003493 [Penicillium argentinense]KAJ5102964.1 hypothetical protein N7532_003493 [Penicillium argentinense]
MASYSLLGQPEEDTLHKARLLNVEEKPFKRVSKRLLNPESLAVSNAPQVLTPPPEESDADATATDADKQKKLDEWRHFNEDVSLDFSAFEGSIARIQFLLASNKNERERYGTQKVRILETKESVRRNNGDLRNQLQGAQQSLARRKGYDELTEKITGNRLLKTREDQQVQLQRLQDEIADLDKESNDCKTTWGERRVQFARVVDEGTLLRRQIRNENEVEEETGDEGDANSRGKSSAANSPRPDSESMTPSQSQDESGKLQVEKGSGNAHEASPLRNETTAEDVKLTAEQTDTEMLDEGEIRESVEEDDELEEGEERPDDHGGRMDTS